MTRESESSQCSVCDKTTAKCKCAGCKLYFCVKHFNEHRQQLSTKFDTHIIKPQESLLKRIRDLNQSIVPPSDLLSQINQWEDETLANVRKAAQKIRSQLVELVNHNAIEVKDQFELLTNEIMTVREEDDFAEDDITRLQSKISQLQASIEQLTLPGTNEHILVENIEVDWNHIVSIEEKPKLLSRHSLNINAESHWRQNGSTVAGGNGAGSEYNQLGRPSGLCIDLDGSIYVSDFDNHRIVRWKNAAKNGEIVAGGNGEGFRVDQLYAPTDLIIDNEQDSLVICDYNNLRLVRWPRRKGKQGEIIISGVRCVGLAMDNQRSIYVSDNKKHEIVRYRSGERYGTIVAGGNGCGNRLDQLQSPRWIFVDKDRAVYVSDNENHRVMKWIEGAKEGILVAGGHGHGSSHTHLSHPCGIVIDQSGTVYVADSWNNRIMRWPKEATQGSIVVGGNGRGDKPNQLNHPTNLSFDRYGNLYVTDQGNHRIQKFDINSFP